MVYGPGRYKFADFLKLGSVLTLIIYVIAIVLVPIVWPLRWKSPGAPGSPALVIDENSIRSVSGEEFVDRHSFSPFHLNLEQRKRILTAGDY